MHNALIIAAAFVYFLPTLAAVARCLPTTDRWHIGLCNLFLGWTVVVWIVCLWWAFAYVGLEEC